MAIWALTTLAACAAVSTLRGDLRPLVAVKKDGKSSWSYVITGTPSVSKNSKVFGMSRMLFTPAQTTHTGVLPSSFRSVDTSHVDSTPR